MPPSEPVAVHERDRPEDEWPGIVRWRTLLGGADDAAVGVTVGLATIDPGASTDGAPHRHAPTEVYLFRSGRGIVHVDDREIAVEPGSVVVVPGGARHFVRNPGTEPLCFHYVFAVDRFAEVVYEFD